MGKLLDKFFRLCFPARCIACAKVLASFDSPFCDECKDSFVLEADCTCEVCGLPIYGGSGATVCARCNSIRYCFVKNIPCFVHKDGPRRSVINLKYHRPAVVRPLARLLYERITMEELSDIDCITFVPSFHKRQRRRGYNQAQLLARYTGKLLNIPCMSLLKKIRDTKDQKTLSRRMRFLNIKDAFRVIKSINYENILIIDDTFTTGATLNECARMLIKAGAKRVYCATVTVRE